MEISYTAKISLPHKVAKNLDKNLQLLSRPARVSDNKHVAWRLQKKWFNRYIKPKLVGTLLTPIKNNGEQAVLYKVTNVRIMKAGGRKVSYDFSAEPYNLFID